MDEETFDEAYLKGLESSVQCMIEDLNISNDNIIMMADQKHFVDWINGKEGTSWERRFTRNKTRNLANVFAGVRVNFKHSNEFKTRATWEELAIRGGDRWIQRRDTQDYQ
ncbi:hypothetical protein PIB30_011316 [Stylosanthes scabra]|uniref:RNase H type-1 domain-containing protein n=1 Tax=Stylosanthes scabra TaxID=79078 RepID=A0ABU6W6E0_9FABA|nr:hypothetical protein [Stylosanthes scabra]